TVAGDALQDFKGCAVCPTQKGPTQQGACEGGRGNWDDLLGIVQPTYAIHRTHRSNVLIDALAFTRKVLFHALAKALNARGQIEDADIDDSAIVHFGHCTPSNLSIGNVVERPAHRGSLILDLSDVMQSHIPLITGAMKRMGKAACN